MVDLTSIWPDWGDQGSQPNDGTQYDKGDNPKAQHFDHLWYHIKSTFSTVESELSSLSSDISSLQSGKADDPHDNSQHSETYTTSSDNVESFSTGGNAGTVPVSQGNGTLSMEDQSVSDSDIIDAINNDSDHGSTAPHNYYTDSDAVSAINNDSDHGSTASHNYYTDSAAVSAIDASDHGTNAPHNYYTDTKAIDATIRDPTLWGVNVRYDSVTDTIRTEPTLTDVQEIQTGGSSLPIDTSFLRIKNSSAAGDLGSLRFSTAADPPVVVGTNQSTNTLSLYANQADTDANILLAGEGGGDPRNNIDGTTEIDGDFLRVRHSDVGSDAGQIKFTSAGDGPQILGFDQTTNSLSITANNNDSADNIELNEETVDPRNVVRGNTEVDGDFDVVNGSKNFVIDHPSDDDKHLRHGAYEGPVAGGLIYRDTVTVEDGTAELDVPDYVLNGDFGHNWNQQVTACEHFGTGYVDTDEWVVHADEDGEYDVLITGERTDDGALSGRGLVTEKFKDETWEEAAERETT